MKKNNNDYKFWGASFLVLKIGICIIKSQGKKEHYFGVFLTEGIRNAWRRFLISWKRHNQYPIPEAQQTNSINLKKVS